jgi:hypothetical protein
MKIYPGKAAGQQGSTIAIALIITALLMISLAGFSALSTYRFRLSLRAESWNMAISVAEAGVEESFAHLFSAGRTNYLANGWTATNSGVVKQRYLADNSYYRAYIRTNDPPTITVDGYLPILGDTNNYLHRTVQLTTSNQYMFARAMLTVNQITGNGNDVLVDSFNSTNALYSTGGQYDAAKRRDSGDIACNAKVSGCIDVGNGDIYGTATTGPGGSIYVGANGGVGSSSWFASGHSGIEPGHGRDDLNVSIPDVVFPFFNGLAPTAGTYSNQNYTYVLGTNDYVLGSLNLGGQNKMIVIGKARLLVTGNVSMSGQAMIIIETNASLALYVQGPSSSLGGNGVMNKTGYAANFQYFGGPDNTSISMSGNATFIGTVYAPEAALTLNGGGNANTDYVGSCVTKSVSMQGHFSFHYDESLKGLYNLGWYVDSWNEL